MKARRSHLSLSRWMKHASTMNRTKFDLLQEIESHTLALTIEEVARIFGKCFETVRYSAHGLKKATPKLSPGRFGSILRVWATG